MLSEDVGVFFAAEGDEVVFTLLCILFIIMIISLAGERFFFYISDQ